MHVIPTGMFMWSLSKPMDGETPAGKAVSRLSLKTKDCLNGLWRRFPVFITEIDKIMKELK